INEETNRLLKHRLAQLVVETLKSLAVNGVVFFEAAKIEPVAAELGSQPTDAIILKHPPRLGDEDLASMKIPRLRVSQQFRVGHARPKDVTQTARQCVIGQWLCFPFHRHRTSRAGDCRPMSSLSRPGSAGILAGEFHDRRHAGTDAGAPGRSSVGISQINAVAKVRRHQYAGDRVADSVFMVQALLLAQPSVESDKVIAFRLRYWPTVSAFCESLERAKVAGFRRKARLFDPANVGGNVFEIILNGADRSTLAAVAASLSQVSAGELLNLGRGRCVLVLRPGKIKLGALREPRRFRPLEKDEVLVLPHRVQGDEVELLPERVQLALALRVEQQIVERRVVAKIARHQMEPGAQQPSMALLVLLEKDQHAFRHVKSVGED